MGARSSDFWRRAFNPLDAYGKLGGCGANAFMQAVDGAPRVSLAGMVASMVAGLFRRA